MKKKLLTAVLAAGLTVMGFGSAHAMEVKLSGQINRAIMWADNGVDSELLHVDNDNSSTRFRLKGSQQVTDSLKVGVVWENEFESNSSSKVDVGQKDDGESAFKERKFEGYFQGAFGKISIGQGDGAANGTSETDLSGTTVIMYSGVNDTAGDIKFRDSNDTEIDKIDATRDNFDGLSRNDRLRYDSPKFGGVTLSASFTNGNAYELAARYAAEMGGFGKIAVALGYVDSDEREDPEFTQLGGSLSWLHTSGINLTFAYGTLDSDGADTDPLNYYAKLGYKFGKHAIAVEYGMTEDLAQENDESSNYGIAYVAKPWKAIELYGTYRVYQLERDGVSDIEDISQLMIGTRIKF